MPIPVLPILHQPCFSGFSHSRHIFFAFVVNPISHCVVCSDLGYYLLIQEGNLPTRVSDKSVNFDKVTFCWWLLCVSWQLTGDGVVVFILPVPHVYSPQITI